MDRNVITATILIALIIVVWMTFLTPDRPVEVPPDAGREDNRFLPDDDTIQPPKELQVPGSVPEIVEGDSTILGTQDGVIREITVENDLYTAVFSTRGGTLLSFKLKEYKKFEEDSHVEMIDSRKVRCQWFSRHPVIVFMTRALSCLRRTILRAAWFSAMILRT